jgi:hypothetical protein
MAAAARLSGKKPVIKARNSGPKSAVGKMGPLIVAVRFADVARDH